MSGLNARDLACIMWQQAGWTEAKRSKWAGPLPQHMAAPHAKETNVYLQYIVDHYDSLPGTVVFMHAHRCACCLQAFHMFRFWTGKAHDMLESYDSLPGTVVFMHAHRCACCLQAWGILSSLYVHVIIHILLIRQGT